jgi:phosphoribosyl-ATP pyrophosphohydrolase/phosphoribosyl-AMP cyclohydrolase
MTQNMTPKDPAYIGNQADIINRAEWAKGDGLLPAIIQNPDTGAILMLGYMNKDAYEATIKGGQVTFFSRSKQRLWTKGETSGNTLDLVSVELDCDNDTLLIMARPNGPTCHTGTTTCFNDKNLPATLFLNQLQNLIVARHKDMPQGSYTTSLFTEGKARIAQKVGEEGVELALARMKDDSNEVTNEAADLLFHMMVLLQDAGLSLGDVIGVLQSRHKISS